MRACPLGPNQISNVVVRVRNAGKEAENNVQAVITLPEGLKLLGLPGVKGFTLSGQKVRLPARALPAGADAQVVLRVQAARAGTAAIAVEVVSDRVGPDAAVKRAEELTVVGPAASKSRKPVASW